MNELNEIIENDPQVIIYKSLLKERMERIRSNDALGRRIDAQGKEIGEIREQTRSIEAVARSANFWGGEHHQTVVSFLKNKGVVVPNGKVGGSHGDETWYSTVGKEFKSIVMRNGHAVQEPRCQKLGSSESKYHPWHYPVEWLEEAFPVWVKAIEIGAYYGGKENRKKWFRNKDRSSLDRQGRLRIDDE